MRRQRATALVEFALVWPLLLLATLGATELAIWSAEAAGARSAALAGARAGAVTGSSAATAQAVAVRVLSSVVAGTTVSAWCGGGRPPRVWVCANDLGSAMEVTVGGSVPALVPLPVSAGLPVHADARVPKESFT